MDPTEDFNCSSSREGFNKSDDRRRSERPCASRRLPPIDQEKALVVRKAVAIIAVDPSSTMPLPQATRSVHRLLLGADR